MKDGLVAGATAIFDRLPSAFTLKVYIPSPKQSPTNIQITDVHMHARMQTHAYKRADARKSHNAAQLLQDAYTNLHSTRTYMYAHTTVWLACLLMHIPSYGHEVFLFVNLMTIKRNTKSRQAIMHDLMCVLTHTNICIHIFACEHMHTSD